MADLRPETGRVPRDEAVWQDDNERGLRFATDGEWGEAREAFATAADALARSLPGNAPAHEPLALVLGNLAHACFRAGDRDEAVQHQKRACALRVAIAGEDGMPVARARMDLAVMLAAAGRLDEANALVQRAIAALDHRVGEEDARLAIVLENAARIAIASGAPANAEPLLLRLHALLDAHEVSTARADALLARVAAVRASQAAAALSSRVAEPSAEHTAVGTEHREDAAPAESPETPEPSADAFDAERPVYAHASIETSEWEDQPLRDAVAVTDVLLRNTPAGVPAITSRHVMLDTPPEVAAVPAALAPGDRDVDDLSLELTDFDFGSEAGTTRANSSDPSSPATDPVEIGDVHTDAHTDVHTHVHGGTAGETAIATDIADDIMATLSPSPAAPSGPAPDEPRDVLDLDLALDDAFTGQDVPSGGPVFGDISLIDTPEDAVPARGEPSDAPEPDTPVPATGLLLDFTVQHGTLAEVDGSPSIEAPPITVPVPHALTPASTAPAQPPTPPLTLANAGPADGVAPLSDMVGTAPPMPRATAEQRAVPNERPSSAPSSAAPRAARSEPAPTSGSKVIPIAIGVVTAIGGVAAYLLTR